MPKIPSSLYSIHLMLMLSPALFVCLVFFVILPDEPPGGISKDQAVVFQTVAAALAVIAVGLSQLLPRLLLQEEKRVPMRRYTTMKIMQWLMLEGAALFIGIVFYMTQQKNLLIPLAVLTVLIALMRPTANEIELFHVKE